jgi:hypothetical protein
MRRDGWRNTNCDNYAEITLALRVAIANGAWTWAYPEHAGTWHSQARQISTLGERDSNAILEI